VGSSNSIRETMLQHSAQIAARAPEWTAVMGGVTNYIMNDCGGGQRVLKLAWVINFQKLATIRFSQPSSRAITTPVPLTGSILRCRAATGWPGSSSI